ncbi:serine hydrolase domain-containing protein [Marinicrinis lubricantis]|uniref:Serine hydrolase domain-containing protein n=1 Tax=Marinicrinis lubricantis TaxID=2086470 RepID=A0ABW1IKU9_9BACL
MRTSHTFIEHIQHWARAYDRNGYLNGSILVASHQQVLLQEGFGMANWEHRVPNTSKTKFRIGSLTKAFTAMCIFQLHASGKLHIHDEIGKYLKNYPNGDQITIYHCLTNSAGIPNYTSFSDFWFRTMRLPMTLDQLIDSFKGLELEFTPGSQFAYSSSGYALLTQIIEIVSGMPYPSYILEHICRPLGMKHTGCDDGSELISGLASGYSYWEKPIHAAYADMSFPLGGYGMYSTVEDLYIWDQALRSNALIDGELTDLMFTPYKGSYGCGWMVSDFLGKSCIHHFGDISGYFSDFLRFHDEQVTVIFLSNMNVTPVSHLSRELAKIVFGGRAALPVEAKAIPMTFTESFIGSYRAHDESFVVSVNEKNEALYVTVPKMYGVMYKFKLIPVYQDSSKTAFVTEMIHETLVIHYAGSGEITGADYTDFHGRSHKLHKVC